MHLYDLPLEFALVGLVLYTVLAGADFGAGIWQLTAIRGERGAAIRDHAHRATGPVWEANHVWLIFVLTVVWTAYPTAFGSIASTLAIPLFIAAIGIIFRGVAYALRSGTDSQREIRTIDTAFAVSSLLTPFALGTMVGGIASQRIPIGNAAGDAISSWLNPMSLVLGGVAVSAAAYLAAVYLAADASRLGDDELERDFRARALGSGLLAGALAIGGIAVTNADAPELYHGLIEGHGLPALIVSVVAGVIAIWMVWTRRYEHARYTAALAVAAIIAGWALAQDPVFLPGLTIEQAAASHDTLVALIVAVLAGAVVLFPSLVLLFRLYLGGRFDEQRLAAAPAPRGFDPLAALAPGLLARSAGACLLAGVGFLTIADPGWAHAIGVAALVAFVVLGFLAAVPAYLGAEVGEPDSG